MNVAGIRQTVPMAALLLVVLAGCGGGSTAQDRPEVASIPATSTEEDAPRTDTEPAEEAVKGRPQYRLDDTEQRRNQLNAAHADCLVENGARYVVPEEADDSALGVDAGNGKVLERPVPAKAEKACLKMLPLDPPEMEPSSPTYRQDWQANVECLRGQGIMVHLTQDMTDPSYLAWTYDEDAPPTPDNQVQIEKDCMLASFGPK